MLAAPARAPMRVAAILIAGLATATCAQRAGAQATPTAAADDQSVDAMLERYRRQAAELDRLQTYTAHVEALLEEQAAALQRLADEQQRAGDLRRDVLPLLTRMVDDLERFVAADLPIEAATRQARIASLRAALRDPSLGGAEKFRRVIEAYRAELDLGRTIGTYRGEIERAGVTTIVNFLHLGRVMLACQSEDRSVTAFWDASAEPPGWRDLPAEYRGDLEQAMRVADRQAAPSLIRLPVPAPEAAR